LTKSNTFFYFRY